VQFFFLLLFSFFWSGREYTVGLIQMLLRTYSASIVDTSTNRKTIALRVYIVLTTPSCLPQSR